MSTGNRVGNRSPYVMVVLTCVAVGVMFPAQYLVAGIGGAAQNDAGLATHYVQRAPWVQGVLYIHIIGAGIALVIGAFQFSDRLRRRLPGLHRVIGRLYVGAVVAGAISGFVLAIVGSAGLNGFFGFGALAVAWLVFTVLGVQAIRRGRIPQHRAWMMRGFAMTYAAVTLRAWQILLMGVLAATGVQGDLFALAYAPAPFLCWVPNIVIAEWLIARRGLPGLRYSTAAPARPLSHVSS